MSLAILPILFIFGLLLWATALALLSLGERTGVLRDYRDDFDGCTCPAHRAVR